MKAALVSAVAVTVVLAALFLLVAGSARWFLVPVLVSLWVAVVLGALFPRLRAEPSWLDRIALGSGLIVALCLGLIAIVD